MAKRHRRIPRDIVVATIGVIVVALNMRTAVSSLSPLYDIIDSEIHVGLGERAILGALPPLGFVVGGLVTPLVSRRFGLERNLLVLLSLMVAGHLVRASADSWVVIAVGSALVLVGAGMGNVSLPPVIKHYFPESVGTMTSTYITVMSLGQIVPPLIAVHVSDVTSWRIALGMWAILAIGAVVPWILEIRRGHSADAADRVTAPRVRVHRSTTAWAVALLLTTSSITGYGMFAWLPDIVKETAGLTDAEAGIVLAIFIGAGTPLALGIPVLASRLKNVSMLVYVGAGLTIVGLLGLAYLPQHTPYFWAIVVGTGPLLFPLALSLINLRTESSVVSLQLSAFAQFFAYAIACTVAPLLGWARAITGGWQLGLTAMALAALIAVWSGRVLSRNHTVEFELRS